ncbi:MAG: hypothetical protein ACRDJT_01425 [Actinomycetota bacterium]
MTELSDRFQKLLSDFEDITDEVTPAEASASLDDPVLQTFWRIWPDLSLWAGSLWRELNDDLDESASPAGDGVTDVGGSG